MAKLLVLSTYSDKDFQSCDYTFVHQQTARLARYFDEIYVVAPNPWVPALAKPLGRFWEPLRTRGLKRDWAFDNVKVFFAPYGPWAGLNPFRDWVRAVWPAIRKTVDRHHLEFDLVHAHMSQVFSWHGAELAARHGVPCVVTIHDSHDWLMRSLRKRLWFLLEGLQRADRLIRVNPNDIDQIAELAEIERKILYIPNGFDLANVPTEPREALRHKLGLSLDRPLFVSAAKWLRRKDPLLLVEALRILKDRGESPLPRLCLLGENLMGDTIPRRIAELGLKGDAELMGQKPPEEVLRYMRASNAVVLFSHSEGNPTIMFEALGCGRPYVGSDVGGVNAVINDERLGLIGPPRDPELAADLMQRALATSWDEDFIRDHAQQYTWENVARRIYEEAFVPLLPGRSVGS